MSDWEYDYQYEEYDDYNYDYDSDGLEIRHYLGSRRFENRDPICVWSSADLGSDSEDDEYSTDTSLTAAQEQKCVPSLVDLSSRFVALNFPFAYIEHREPPVPEELQLKIISFAFPDNKETVMKFAEFSRIEASMTSVNRLSREVKELHQIGFRLSGSVAPKQRRKYKSKLMGLDSICKETDEIPFVTVYFDRGKITEAYCTACDESDVGWCDHVLAVIMARINKQNTCKIYPPVSDSLNQLSREQLLKFSQYLLTDHHKKPTILESAQALLDKLLQPHKHQPSTFSAGKADEGMAQAAEEDLNNIPGAPDPTAGPGMADKAHWFLCKQSFGTQSNFKKLSLKEMGFVVGTEAHVQAPLTCSKCKTLEGFVLDGLEPWIEEDYRYKRNFFETSTSPKGVSTAYEMLRDDYGTAMAAIVRWTDDVFNRETTHSPKEKQKMLNYVMAEGLENHYTPRPFSWNMSCDLAKLWRVAVLNPRLTKGNRDGMAHQLYERAENASLGANVRTTKPWPGFIIAMKLLQLDLHCPELQALFQGKIDVLPEVCSCSDERLQCNIQYTACENTEDNKRNVKDTAEDGGTDCCGNVVTDRTESKPQQTTEDSVCALVSSLESMKLSQESGELSHLHIPRLLQCGDLLHDVNTYLAVAEALKIYGYTVAATYLSCAISFALLKFYYNCIQGKPEYCARQMQGVHMSGDKADEVKFSSPLSLPNVALLYSIISSEPNTVENWWQNLKKAQQDNNEKTSIIETVSSSASFVFQVGILGLLIPMSPAAFPELEGDNFHHEKWLVHQLMASSPVDSDLKFLSHCLDVMNNIPAQLTLSISLAHLLFHHSFKDISVIESLEAMASVQQSVMEGTISVMGLSLSCTSLLSVLWRKAAYFAKEVLKVTATCLSLHERVIEKLIQSTGLFGEDTLRRWSATNSSPAEHTINYNYKAKTTGVHFDAKNTLYALAMALHSSSYYQGKQEVLCPNVVFEEETDETENSAAIGCHDERTKVLRKSQITLLMHVLSLPVTRRFPRDEVFRDLLKVLQVGKFEENVKNLQELHRNFVDAFWTDEVLKICEELLKEEDSKARDRAENVLTGFVKHKASVGDAENDLSRVVEWLEKPTYSYALRDRNQKNRRLPLLPGVCQQLSSMANSGKVSFKVLSKAAVNLSGYAKIAAKRKPDRDSSTTEEETVTDPDSLLQTAFDLGVSSLQCVEKWWQESGGRPDECRMVTRSLKEICQMVKDISQESKPYAVANREILGVSVQNRNQYVDKFLTVALATIETPTWIFLIVEEIAPLFPAPGKPSPRHWRDHQQYKIGEACNQSYLLRMLLERCRKAFAELLRGPELNKKLEQVSQENPFNGRRGLFRRTWSEIRAFDRVKMNDGLTLRECLKQTKRTYLALYDKAGTAAFYSLFKELESTHPILSVIAQEYTND